MLALLFLFLSVNMMLQHHMVIAEAQERKQQYSQTIRDNYQPAVSIVAPHARQSVVPHTPCPTL